jgi:hypothetical protein
VARENRAPVVPQPGKPVIKGASTGSDSGLILLSFLLCIFYETATIRGKEEDTYEH